MFELASNDALTWTAEVFSYAVPISWSALVRDAAANTKIGVCFVSAAGSEAD
jgi:hypothetical protein